MVRWIETGTTAGSATAKLGISEISRLVRVTVTGPPFSEPSQPALTLCVGSRRSWHVGRVRRPADMLTFRANGASDNGLRGCGLRSKIAIKRAIGRALSVREGRVSVASPASTSSHRSRDGLPSKSSVGGVRVHGCARIVALAAAAAMRSVSGCSPPLLLRWRPAPPARRRPLAARPRQ